MTTVLAPLVDLIDLQSDPEALATAELRTTCEEFGFPVPQARIRFDGDGPVRRVVVAIPPDLPWRVADAAVVRALRLVRTAWPEARFADHRFEDCLLAD